MGAGSPRQERGAHAQRRRETQAALRRIPCVPSYQLCTLSSFSPRCVGCGAGGAAGGKQRKRKGQEEDGETQRKKAKGKAKPEPGPKRKKKRGKVDPNATLAKGYGSKSPA